MRKKKDKQMIYDEGFVKQTDYIGSVVCAVCIAIIVILAYLGVMAVL